MELWIRSQDKMTLKKIDDISISQNLFTNEYTIFCDHNVFGDYPTKERALEVLDEIQEIIKPQIITTSYECECKDNPLNKMSFNLEMIPTKTEIQELSVYVYEMPKE